MDDIFTRAVKFAADAHAGAMRKGTDIPYIVHPMEAAAIAATLTSDPDVLAAAVLHDTVEDTSTTIAQIKELFGEKVAALVQAESEDKREELPAAETWEVRKQETLSALNECRDRDKLILVLGDKLSNIRAISRDYEQLGDELWKRFNQKDKSRHAWYYGSIARALSPLSPSPAYREYCELVKKVFG